MLILAILMDATFMINVGISPFFFDHVRFLFGEVGTLELDVSLADISPSISEADISELS